MKKTLIAPKPQQPSSAAVNPDAWVSGQSLPKPASAERTKRFTFDVPESLHRRVKAGCAAKGVDMADIMRDFLEKEFPDTSAAKS